MWVNAISCTGAREVGVRVWLSSESTLRLLDAFLFPVPRASYDRESFPGRQLASRVMLCEASWCGSLDKSNQVGCRGLELHSAWPAACWHRPPAPGSQMVPCLLSIYEPEP